MLRESGSGNALRIALVAVAGLLLAATLVVAYFLLDSNRLKGALEKLVNAQTGRDLTIVGDVSIRLGRHLGLSVSGAELGNADWAAEPVMVRVKRLDVIVDVASLLDGPLLIEELGIEGAQVHLEKAADGSANWQLFEDDGEKESGFAFDEGLPVVLRQLNIEDCLVIYATPERNSPLHLEIVSLDQKADAQDFLDLNGEGVLQGRPIRIEGTIGPFAALLEARNFRHVLAVNIGDTKIRTRGSVGDLNELEDVELVLEIEEPDAGFYGDLLGVPGALNGPIDLEVALSPSRPGIRAEASGHVGGFDIALTGRVEQPLDLDALDMEVHLAGPDLAVLGEMLEIPGLPAGPFDLAGGLSRSGGTLVIREGALSAGGGELTIDAELAEFPDPDGGTALVNLRGSDLGRFDRLLGPLPTLRQQPFEATVALTQRGEGDEHIEAAVVVGENRLALEGVLGSYPEYPGSRFEVDLRGPDFADLAGLLGPTAKVTGPYRASGHLAWTGAVLEIEKLVISTGPIDLRGSGSLKNLPSLDGAIVFLDAAGSDLFALGEWMGTDALPNQPYSLSGRLGWRGKEIDVEEIRGHVGEVGVTGAARIGDPSRLASVQLDLNLKGPALDELIAEPLGFTLDDTPFELSGRLERRDRAIEVSDLRYRSSNTFVSIDGNLGAPPSFVGMKLAIAAQGPSIRRMLPDIPGYTPPDRPYRLSGRAERAGDQALVFDELSVELGGVSATASGVWDFPREPEAARFNLRASGSDLNDLGEWQGLALPAVPFTLEAAIDGTPGSVALHALSARWGESDIRGHAVASFSGKPRITAAVGSDRLDLSPFLQGEDDGAAAVVEPASDDWRVVPDVDLPLQALKSADVSFDVDVAELIVGPETLEHLKLDLVVQDGAVRIEPLEFIESDGSVLLNLALTPTPRKPELALTLTTRNLRFGFFGAEGQAVDTLPPYDIKMSLESTGDNTREIVAALSGPVRIESSGGVIVNSRIERWFDDFFMQLFEAILPGYDDNSSTRIDCAVLDASFDDGILGARPGLVVRTDRLNLFARGSVNLANERLNVDFRTEARRGVGISVGRILNPFVKVGGTLGNPVLKLDATGAAISGTAAVATGGLSIALRTLWDRIQGTQNPCVRMLNNGE